MSLGKLLSLPVRLRRTPADPAGRALAPNHVSAPQQSNPIDAARPSFKLRRESISTNGPSTPAYGLLRPGQVVVPYPLDAVGRRLAQAASILDLIAQLDNPASARALQQTRRLSLTVASGRAEAEQFQAICERLCQRCPNLEQLEVLDAVLSAPAAHALSQLPRLSVLALNNDACTERRRQPLPDQVLEHLARSNSLRTLMLGNADLPARGVAPLAELASLRSLSLSNCAFYAHDLESIRTLHRLEAFYHRGNEDCAAIPQAVASLLHLETLFLSKLQPDGKTVNIAPLHTLTHLRRLRLTEPLLTSASLRALGKGCAMLQELHLHSPTVREYTGPELRRFPRLRVLHVSGNITGTQPNPEIARALVAMRKQQLTQVQIPGQRLPNRFRHDLLRSFGATALSYGPAACINSAAARAIQNDRAWLIKNNMLDEQAAYPIAWD